MLTHAGDNHVKGVCAYIYRSYSVCRIRGLVAHRSYVKDTCVSYQRMRRILMIGAIIVVGFILLSPIFMGLVRRLTGRSPKE